MPPRLTLAEMHAVAATRGGTCLSTEYINARTALRWRCAQNHEWSALPSNIRDHRSWCPACSGMTPHTLDEMQALATERGGACLSNAYHGINRALRWRCSCAHEWEALPKTVLNGTWCPKCAGNLRSDLVQMQAVAARRGGECVSTEYLGDGQKLSWRCTSGHEFAATPSNVKRGRWCPECSTGLGERLTRNAFEQLFGERFPRTWPSWLVGEHGARMELDGYSERLGLAFEHQGDQHYQELRHFHTSSEDFAKQIRRDETKRCTCIANGVTLIEVPEVPQRTSIAALAGLVANAVQVAMPSLVRATEPEAVLYDDVYRTDSAARELLMLRRKAEARGGRLVSAHYAGRHERLEWECSEAHRWRASPANILQDKWCSQCARCAKLTIDDLHAAAANMGGVCLATHYVNNGTKVRWQCSRGHQFVAGLATVRRGHWCAQCKGVARYDESIMREIAAAHGGQYLSTEYRGMNETALWMCANGHKFELTPSSVKNRGRWCGTCRQKMASSS